MAQGVWCSFCCRVVIGVVDLAVALCADDWVWCVEVKCVAVAGCCFVEQVVCVCGWCDYLICFVLGIVSFLLLSCVMCACDFVE